MNNFKPMLAALTAVMLWALSLPLLKIALTEIDPASLAFLRVAIGVVLLFVVSVGTDKTGEIRALLRDNLREIVIMVLTGTLVYHVLQNFGIKFTLASVTGIITGSEPVFLIILSAIFLREVLTKKQVLGIVIATLGLAVIFLAGQNLAELLSSRYFFGNSLVLISVVSTAVFTIYGKILTRKYSPLAISTALFLLGTPVLLAAQFALGGYSFVSASLSTWLIVLFLGTFCSAVSYLMWVYALEKADISKVSVFLYLLPVGAIVFSVLLLGEVVTLSHLAGTALILVGVYVAER